MGTVTSRMRQNYGETLLDTVNDDERQHHPKAVGMPQGVVAEEPHIVTVQVVQAEGFRSRVDEFQFVIWHIKLRYKGFQWTVHRRYNEFKALKKAYESVTGEALPDYAQLPPRHIFKRRFDRQVIQERCEQLPNFVQYIADCKKLWATSSVVWQFFEVSPGSFDRSLGRKGREGWLCKLSGGRSYHASTSPVSNWKYRWFTLRDCAIVWYKRQFVKEFPQYCHERRTDDTPTRRRAGSTSNASVELDVLANEVSQTPDKDSRPQIGVFLVDDAFSIFFDNSKRYILLKNRTRSLALKTSSTRDFVSWMVAFAEMYRCPVKHLQAGGTLPNTFSPRMALVSKGDYITLFKQNEMSLFGSIEDSAVPFCKHAFRSGFPCRQNVLVAPLIGGQDTFLAIFTAILSAQRDILITDWWLEPNIALFRPGTMGIECSENEEPITLLDVLLERARNGVHIRVLLYNEVPGIMNNNSRSAEAILNNAHPNIQVIRHPQNFAVKDITSRVWSHHEKTVTVDERIAFVGGIDLCQGRYDRTKLNDLIIPWSALPQREREWYNPRIEAAVDRRPSAMRSTMVKEELPRMPWQDVATVVGGRAALDVGFHFIRRWNHHLVQRRLKSTYGMAVPKSDFCAWWKVGMGNVDDKLHLSFNGWSEERLGSLLNKYIPANVSGLFSECLPRFRSTWNHLGFEPGLKLHCPAQVLSSVSNWSTGLPGKEASIENAMCHAIEEAEHFVYIENQFFLSLAGLDEVETKRSSITSQYPHNKVNNAIYKRLSRAIANDETFRVIIVVPCLPEDADTSAVLRTLLYWQLQSLFIGKFALLPKLRKEMRERYPQSVDADLRNYISVCSLAQCQLLPLTASLRTMHNHLLGASWIGEQNVVVLEEIYVHSKVLIVDDTLAILGSANINDRSLLGTGDSELSVRFGWLNSEVEDIDMQNYEQVPCTMGGQPWKACAPVQDLRIRLWKKHLGDEISDDSLNDVCSSQAYNDSWLAAADKNTRWCINHFGEKFMNEHLFDVNEEKVEAVEKMTSDNQWTLFTTIANDPDKASQMLSREQPNVPIMEELTAETPVMAEEETQISEDNDDNDPHLASYRSRRLLIHTPSKLWRGACRNNIEELLPKKFTVYDIARGALL